MRWCWDLQAKAEKSQKKQLALLQELQDAAAQEVWVSRCWVALCFGLGCVHASARVRRVDRHVQSLAAGPSSPAVAGPPCTLSAKHGNGSYWCCSCAGLLLSRCARACAAAMIAVVRRLRALRLLWQVTTRRSPQASQHQ